MIAILREYGVSQVPVLKVEPPVVAAEVLGSVQDRDLLEAAFQDHELLVPPVGEVTDPASHYRGGRTGGVGRGPDGEFRRRPRLRRRAPGRDPDPIRRPRSPRRSFDDVDRRGPRSTMDTSDAGYGFATRAIHSGQDPDP